MEQKCPLCDSNAISTYEKEDGKIILKILCPQCAKLSFEEETENRISSCVQEVKERFITLAKQMTEGQVLVFSLDSKVRNSAGEDSVNATIMDKPGC